MSKTSLSQSRLFALQNCGEFYRRKYVEGDHRPGTLRMHRGGAVHEAAREAHKRQVLAKKEAFSSESDAEKDEVREVLRTSVPSLDESESIASDAFDHGVLQGVVIHSDDVSKAGSKDLAVGRQKDMAVAMAGHYNLFVAPEVNPVAFERRITVDTTTSSGDEVVLQGILDLVEERLDTGEVIVPDLKTTERTPPKDQADKSEQLTFYATLRLAETGKLPDAALLRSLVSKSGVVQVVERTTRVTEGDVDAMLARVDSAVKAINAGIFVPAYPGSWMCSAKWCQYFSDCRFALQRR